MREGARIAVVIPALNEERSLGLVLDAVPRWVDDVVVVDNGSTDQTAAVARAHGARVLAEPRRGYGRACLTGIAALVDPEVVVFLDADFSDHPDEMASLVDPILSREADLVIGSRVRGERERGALTPQARFGNGLACLLLRHFWGVRYTDLGPFRAIRHSTLQRLHMQDQDFGWTVEMQVKAAAAGVPALEVPVRYRRRIGASKISGTVRGVVLAGAKILYTILRAVLRPGRGRVPSPRGRLCVFTRYPEAGRTKTRLIPALGVEGAARIQFAMTAHVLDAAEALARGGGVTVEVRFEGGDERAMRASFGAGLRYVPQGGGDLGERMCRCAREALAAGEESVVIVGADVPGLDAALLRRAFDTLRTDDVVVGPAADGGYYLIGMRGHHPGLFADMPWGTEAVLPRLLAAAAVQGLAVGRLPTREDVDRPEDLPVAERAWGGDRLREALAPITVIVPTLNEAACIDATLQEVCGVSCAIEVIVVDGGSRDDTRERAAAHGARVLVETGGRACQMNAGAAVATGSVLLFLHADTLLPPGFPRLVRDALAQPRVIGGAFAFRLDGAMPSLRLIEWCTNWRARVLQLPYGDQALFLRRETFQSLGGFAVMPILEDFEFVRRLRRRGALRIVSAPVVTSSRRWRQRGVVGTTLVNQLMLAGYALGISPHRLARWYRGPGTAQT